MKRFENESCPVCKRLFEEDDDIVVCPECGTPHHRECYALVGHCVNRSLHASGYDYTAEHPYKKESATPLGKPKPQAENAEADSVPRGGFFLPPIPNGAQFQTDDQAQITIGGESLGDVSSAIGANAQRFVKVFRTQEAQNTKRGWNWGAFFFGAYYFFFRKMFKQGITLLCVQITVSSLFTLLASKLAPLTVAAIGAMTPTTMRSDPEKVMQSFEEIQSLGDFQMFTRLTLALLAARIVIALAAALFADSSYKTTVLNLVRRVNAQLAEGASFDTPGFSEMTEDMPRLDQQQMKRIYLARKGGVSVFAPALAYLVYSLLTTYL